MDEVAILKMFDALEELFKRDLNQAQQISALKAATNFLETSSVDNVERLFIKFDEDMLSRSKVI